MQGTGFTSAMARTDGLRLNSGSTVWKKTGRMEMDKDRRPNTHGSRLLQWKSYLLVKSQIFLKKLCASKVSHPTEGSATRAPRVSNTHQPLLCQVTSQSLYLCNRDKGFLIFKK